MHRGLPQCLDIEVTQDIQQGLRKHKVSNTVNAQCVSHVTLSHCSTTNHNTNHKHWHKPLLLFYLSLPLPLCLQIKCAICLMQTNYNVSPYLLHTHTHTYCREYTVTRCWSLKITICKLNVCLHLSGGYFSLHAAEIKLNKVWWNSCSCIQV